ncbi:biogenesis of lysosome-related organelles complex 1 subunit 4-like isoform X2 [Ostrea edulis]|uniref:biogenesis of lysosome-related organelles complex 1 subunit 4-like isoform X2 n=1 Tax=Ostrea edulis TaxID=37623 RepID=UPI002094E4B9|nr:biogenesis of lysosome-related organelles complex 1 subunit 4-like isoform X2 [Ostrea edulis]
MEETSITTASESSPVTQEETLYTVVEDLAADYVSYAKFDSAKEKEKFNENIEEMLAKLEEFCGMVDAAFVGVVKGNVAVLEECVNKAEDEMGSLSGLKKMLSSFVGPKKPVSKSDKKAVFEPPEIFSTKDYFPQPQGSNQTEEGGSAEK